jgi:hypothetical protein
MECGPLSGFRYLVAEDIPRAADLEPVLTINATPVCVLVSFKVHIELFIYDGH